MRCQPVLSQPNEPLQPQNIALLIAKDLLASFSQNCAKTLLASQQLPLPRREPADAFLAATAQLIDWTLVTCDDNLLGLGRSVP